MNKILAIFLLGIGTLGAAQERVEFSIIESIEYALENAETLKITKLEQDLSNAVVAETRGIGLPQVNLNGGLNYNYAVQTSLVDFSNFDPTLPKGTEGEIAFGLPYDANWAFSVNQLLFDGSYFVALKAANTYRELSEKDHQKSKIDIVESVSKSYYTVLVNRERLALLQKNYQRLDSLVRETSIMYDNGFVEKIDVDRLRVTLNNIKVERDRLTSLSDFSEKLLKFQMGMPLEQEIVLTESLDNVDLTIPVITSDFTYTNRVEFSKVETNQSLVVLDMKNNKVGRLPKVYAGFNYGFNTGTTDASNIFKTDRWFNFGTLGLTASHSIFDGLMRESKIQQNKIQFEQLEFQKTFLRKSIDLEIAQSNINLNSSLQGLEVQDENRALAEEIYGITKRKFQEGVGSNLEVLEADSSLKEAQTNYYQALYDAIIAKIDLQKALGRL